MDGAKSIRVKDGIVTTTPIAAPVGEAPVPDAVEYCRIFYAADMSFGGTGASLYTGGEPDFHPGSCRGEYVRLTDPGDWVEVTFYLDDAAAINLNTISFPGPPSWTRGCFAIVGMEVTSVVGASTVLLHINGNVKTAVRNDAAHATTSVPTGLWTVGVEDPPEPWKWSYYRGPSGPITDFVSGMNTVRVELSGYGVGGTPDYIAIEQFIFGQDGEVDTGECLQRDDSDPDSPVCFNCCAIVGAPGSIFGLRAQDLASSTGANPLSEPLMLEYIINVTEESTLYINSVFTFRLKSTNTMTTTSGVKVLHKSYSGNEERVSNFPAHQDNLFKFDPVAVTPSEVPYVVNQIDVVSVHAGEVIIQIFLYEKFEHGYLNTQIIVGEDTNSSTMPVVFES